MILVLVTVGTVVGLSIHFIEPTKELGLKEAVLILSTQESSNVPMVITSTGESKQDSTLPVSIGSARQSVIRHPLIRVIFIT